MSDNDGDEFNNDTNFDVRESSDNNSNSDSSHDDMNFNDNEICDTATDNYDRSIVKSVIRHQASGGYPIPDKKNSCQQMAYSIY